MHEWRAVQGDYHRLFQWPLKASLVTVACVNQAALGIAVSTEADNRLKVLVANEEPGPGDIAGSCTNIATEVMLAVLPAPATGHAILSRNDLIVVVLCNPTSSALNRVEFRLDNDLLLIV